MITQNTGDLYFYFYTYNTLSLTRSHLAFWLQDQTFLVTILLLIIHGSSKGVPDPGACRLTPDLGVTKVVCSLASNAHHGHNWSAFTTNPNNYLLLIEVTTFMTCIISINVITSKNGVHISPRHGMAKLQYYSQTFEKLDSSTQQDDIWMRVLRKVLGCEYLMKSTWAWTRVQNTWTPVHVAILHSRCTWKYLLIKYLVKK